MPFARDGETGLDSAGLSGCPSARMGATAWTGPALGGLDGTAAAAVADCRVFDGRFCFDLERNPGANPAKPAEAGFFGSIGGALASRGVDAASSTRFGCSAAISSVAVGSAAASAVAAVERSSASNSSRIALMSSLGRSGIGLSFDTFADGPEGDAAGGTAGEGSAVAGTDLSVPGVHETADSADGHFVH